MAWSCQNELKDSSITKQFEDLIERWLDYERLLAEEQQAASELERRIRERQQQISQQQKDMHGWVRGVVKGRVGGVTGIELRVPVR